VRFTRRRVAQGRDRQRGGEASGRVAGREAWMFGLRPTVGGDKNQCPHTFKIDTV
jgi:hypothetical protein